MLVYIIVQTIVGGKDMSMRRMLYIAGIMGLSIVLAGCFQGEQSLQELDPPQDDAEAVDSLDDKTIEDAADTNNEDAKADESDEDTDVNETVSRQLFLIDAGGMVASQTLELPKLESKEVAAQALEYLVKGGPVTNILPNGFQAVLPEGTEILSLNLQEDGTLIVDVSKEFENYEAQNELKILQAMTYTLTQFENVEEIQLMINGYPLAEMPVNGTPIAEGYSRANGINMIETDTLDLINSKPVTLYYPAEYNNNQYFLPVTQYVMMDDADPYASIVQALLEGPGYTTNLTRVFNADASLITEPSLKNGVLELVFNQNVLKDSGSTTIADDVMETLVRTLTDYQDVEALQVKVESVEKLYNERGEAYDKPVTKKVFVPTEKL